MNMENYAEEVKIFEEYCDEYLATHGKPWENMLGEYATKKGLG
jgi:L-rhamnose mutarotase